MSNQTIVSNELTTSSVIDETRLALVSGGDIGDVFNKIGNDAENGAAVGGIVGGGVGAVVGGVASGGVGAVPGLLAGGGAGAVIGGIAGGLWGLGRGIKDEITG